MTKLAGAFAILATCAFVIPRLLGPVLPDTPGTLILLVLLYFVGVPMFVFLALVFAILHRMESRAEMWSRETRENTYEQTQEEAP
jgi:hypothetical protein